MPTGSVCARRGRQRIQPVRYVYVQLEHQITEHQIAALTPQLLCLRLCTISAATASFGMAVWRRILAGFEPKHTVFNQEQYDALLAGVPPVPTAFATPPSRARLSGLLAPRPQRQPAGAITGSHSVCHCLASNTEVRKRVGNEIEKSCAFFQGRKWGE